MPNGLLILTQAVNHVLQGPLCGVIVQPWCFWGLFYELVALLSSNFEPEVQLADRYCHRSYYTFWQSSQRRGYIQTLRGQIGRRRLCEGRHNQAGHQIPDSGHGWNSSRMHQGGRGKDPRSRCSSFSLWFVHFSYPLLKRLCLAKEGSCDRSKSWHIQVIQDHSGVIALSRLVYIYCRSVLYIPIPR